MSTIIHCENLGKAYTLRHPSASGGGTYRRFSEELVNGLRKRFRRGMKKAAAPTSREEFWALRDVSFDVEQGEVLGIIGRNGAGKSTLLKVLSRITEPSEGRVRLKGRVASLLEVGTGFHPELTGRENIYLNGAILGMTRLEIRKNFDEIVAFADVERFLDTPVKRYSSGMYVRLAFAVAAHLNPEILVVDEVLAVGDAQFQAKCIHKMQDVSSCGRTVLFVSHNTYAIRRLCTRAILLENGALARDGEVGEVVDAYSQDSFGGVSGGDHRQVGPNAIAWCQELKVCPDSPKRGIRVGEPLRFSVTVGSRAQTGDLIFHIALLSADGRKLAHLASRPFKTTSCRVSKVLDCVVDSNPFYPGCYTLNVAITQAGTVIDYLKEAAVLNVVGWADGNLSCIGYNTNDWGGEFLVRARWTENCDTPTDNLEHSIDSKSPSIAAAS